MASRRAADDVVDDLLLYDDVLQSRIETLVQLVARESALRENAEFYKHRTAHHTNSHQRRMAQSDAEPNAVEGSSGFDDARSEMTTLFRKLHRKLAASSAVDAADSQSASEETDSGKLPFAISNLSSLLRSGSVVSSSATRANLREILRNPQAVDANATEAHLRSRLHCSSSTVSARREELLHMLCADCERITEGSARVFRDQWSYRTRSAGACGCDRCLTSWSAGLQSLVSCATCAVPSLAALGSVEGSEMRRTLANQLLRAKRSLLTSGCAIESMTAEREQLVIRLCEQRAISCLQRRTAAGAGSGRPSSHSSSLLRLRDAAVLQAETQAICDAVAEGSKRALAAVALCSRMAQLT